LQDQHLLTWQARKVSEEAEINNGVIYFDSAALLFMVSFFVWIVAHVLHYRSVWRIGMGLFIAGFLSETAGLIVRGFLSGRFPVTNTYESLIFYAWVLSLAYIIFLVLGGLSSGLKKRVGIGVGLLVSMLLALAGSPLRSPELLPLAPLLRSHWLALHVGFVFLGEGFFTIAFIAAVVRLLVSGSRYGEGDDSPKKLDSLIRKAIGIGFPLFTLGGLFFGAIWAKHAWGRFWGWDPKEIFMLVTWLVYGLYLFVSGMAKFRGKRSAWIAVIGWMLAVFTFAGVNFLMVGLHGYR
jgi:cytochrome c-type biogenesis protein CcsB